MSLKLMYITNKPEIALIAQNAGVDRIFVDLETLGKLERQGHVDSVKSNHSIEDIKIIRKIVKTSELLVRINPINPNSKSEIEEVINSGADIIMLPMFKCSSEVQTFIDFVDYRVKTILLLETKEAVENIVSILDIKGISEVHLGLNDLHLAYKKQFMFELFTDGTVEKLTRILKKSKLDYGIGGIARVGFGLVPAEYIIAEHYNLGSNAAILSRAFCNAPSFTDLSELEKLFVKEVAIIRNRERIVSKYSEQEFIFNKEILYNKINNVANSLRSKG